MKDSSYDLFFTPVDEANQQQRVASNPKLSVFVSASAGSGKTKLLVDRLLRLMLPRIGKDGKLHSGTHPQKIQCLTYSKAAAAEMAIRLQKKLSEWVGFSDDKLDLALQDLEIAPNEATRKAARALFAQVLDLPGGMRIETNHAFCQSILQRFPLEASINPQFKVIEEGDNILAFKRAFDEKISIASPVDVQLLSPIITNYNFLQILQELQQHQKLLFPILKLQEEGRLPSYLKDILGCEYDTHDQYLQSVCKNWMKDESTFKQLLQQAYTAKGKYLQNIGYAALQWLDLTVEERIYHWSMIMDCFLTQSKDIKKTIKGAKDDPPEIAEALKEHAHYIKDVYTQLNRYSVYEYTLALLNVFYPIWERYQSIKRTQGALYYNDLIAYTLILLDDPGSAWVLYKLDGGLEHILLDEVQDNSAEQWKIAADLSTEFFAGLGRDENDILPRTVFAVGDYKQSIYSFQGAKPQEFAHWHQEFRQQVIDAGQLWEDPELRVSFRSSQIILDFVDQVFTSDQALQGLSGGDINQPVKIKHRSAKEQAPGRVDIWPLVGQENPLSAQGMEIWNPLRHNQHYDSAELILAEQLSLWIENQIGTVPPYGGEPIQAGDILILIRKRSNFSKALIRSLKSKHIPLANLVKTQLLDQLAVQDLLALCEILLLPQDDLTLACVLKSPLCGIGENSLMELAAKRTKNQSLWGALYIRHQECQEWAAIWEMLSKLFLRIDYVTPYALLVEILGEHQGRAKLLARLGPEAIEGIDELLSQALQYETLHTPSLQGFLYWLKQSERMVKNESESTVNMVRIMTVHGAKGLQGRLVILPDTMNLAFKQGGFQSDNAIIWKEDKKNQWMVPLYVPGKQFNIVERDQYIEDKKQSDLEESNRLLYVALTRASEWLLICGWHRTSKNDQEKAPIGNWYQPSVAAIEKLYPQIEKFTQGWEGDHLYIQFKQLIKAKESNKHVSSHHEEMKIILPSWMGQDTGWQATFLQETESSVAHLVPSRPEGVNMGEIPAVISPSLTKSKKDPFLRGRLIHQLLQYLPDCPKEDHYGIALRWLKQLESQYSLKDIEKTVKQVIAVMHSSELQVLFDSKSLVEQSLVGTVNGVVISGQIDRMRILSDQILLCDFKSGRVVPKMAEEVPIMYLKQMAAYWALLKLIYPHHIIKPFIVWTDTTKIMVLPDYLLMKYQPKGKE